MKAFINPKKQSGSVIVISMMFLIGLSMIAVSAIKSGNLNMKIINNENQRDALRFQVMQAIEQVIHDPNLFIIEGQEMFIDGQQVDLAKECLFSQQAMGYGANFGQAGGDLANAGNNLVPQDTLWRVTAIAVNAKNVTAGAIQGVRMRMLAGSC